MTRQTRKTDDSSHGVRRDDIRRAYRIQHRLLLAVVTGSTILGLLYVARPEWLHQTALGMSLNSRPLELAWNAALLAGGALALYGVLALRGLAERAGLVLLAAVFAVDAVVLIDIRGPEAASLTATMFAFLAWGCAWRALGR